MNLYQKWCYKKADIKLKRLLKFYNKSETILDIGSGNCALNLQIKNYGYDITGLDISNKSAFQAYNESGCAESINNRSNCNTCGDSVCDTPADSGQGKTNGYSPDLTNLMSYLSFTWL